MAQSCDKLRSGDGRDNSMAGRRAQVRVTTFLCPRSVGRFAPRPPHPVFMVSCLPVFNFTTFVLRPHSHLRPSCGLRLGVRQPSFAAPHFRSPLSAFALETSSALERWGGSLRDRLIQSSCFLVFPFSFPRRLRPWQFKVGCSMLVFAPPVTAGLILGHLSGFTSWTRYDSATRRIPIAPTLPRARVCCG